MITVIAPHARPEFAANLRANFERQLPGHRLVVVENGPAVGSWEPSWGVTVLRSEHHQADAMNVGLAWLRDHGDGPWARFDDDDYYSAHYLFGVERQLAEHPDVNVVGKPWGFVAHDEGLFRFSPVTTAFTGGTLAASSADVLPFQRRQDDDVDWTQCMRDRGARLLVGDPWGYCYDRRSRASERVISGGLFESRFAWGTCEFFGQLPPSAIENFPFLSPIKILLAPTKEEIFIHLGAA